LGVKGYAHAVAADDTMMLAAEPADVEYLLPKGADLFLCSVMNGYGFMTDAEKALRKVIDADLEKFYKEPAMTTATDQVVY
jgi:hypothetical protein